MASPLPPVLGMETLAPTVTAQAESPLPAGPLLVKPDESCAFVIFGASGDLTGRKLVPALYNLFCQDLLPPGFAVLGFAFTPLDDAGFRERMRDLVKNSPEVLVFRQKLWDAFAPALHYLTADFTSAAGYETLSARLAELDRDHDTAGNRLFYLATSPSFYGPIVENLGRHGLVNALADATKNGWTRVIVEKPFGHDLASARRLNDTIHAVFDESQIFRIDHYLGKETVQNLLAFRFVNAIIEPIWDRRYVDHVQITAAEKLGVEHRARYYEEAGCLRDMFQNHLLQLLALVAMDPPVRYGSQSVRDRKADVLRAIVPPDATERSAVRGQYGQGTVGGVSVPGYRDEPDVAPDSQTETYAALKLEIDNWRWAGVPFYLRSGKRMPEKRTLIAIQFNRVPHLFFAQTPRDQIEPNVLTIRIQPDEGISLRLGAKMPGPQMQICQVQMDFSYSAALGEFPATAYETLLLDALQNDPTLFNRSDAVELSWQVLEPILRAWQTGPERSSNAPFPNYAAGSWGPPAADALLVSDGRVWRNG